MKFSTIILVCATFVFASAAEPSFYWNFEKGNPGGLGSIKKKINRCNLIEKEGFEGSTGLNCGPDNRNFIAYFSGIAWPEITVELKFKPTAALKESKGGTLLSYAVNSYYRRQFTLRLEPDGKITAWFEIRDDKDPKKVLKTVKVTGESNKFMVGQWYTVRVAAASGRELQIWLDGKIYAVAGNSLGFNDLDGYTPKEYPFLGIGYNVYGAAAMSAPFHGVIDDLKIWKGVAEPSVEAISHGTVSRKDPNLLVTGRDRLEWSEPFTVYDRETSTLGAFEKADRKFQENAARTAVQIDADNLYVTFRCPVPEDTQVEVSEDVPWRGDCVEFFCRTSPDGYYQYVVNAGGAMAAYRYAAEGVRDNKWRSGAIAGVKKTGQEYVVEIKIPRHEIELAGQSVPLFITGNFTRSGATAGSLSSWSAVGRNFHNTGGFGKLLISSREEYFMQKLRHLNADLAQFPSSELKSKAEAKIAEASKIIASQGNDPHFWDQLSNSIYNLEQLVLQLSLRGKPYLITESPGWENIHSPMKNIKQLRKISVTMGRNSRVLYGFSFSNLTERPFMGQLKFLAALDNLSRFNAQPDNVLYRHLKLYEGIPVPEQNSQSNYDPLCELPLNSLLRVPAKTTSPLWLMVDSNGLAAGKYDGYLYLKSSSPDFPDEKIELEMNVLDIDLKQIKVDSFNYNYLPVEMFHLLSEYELNCLYAGTPGSRNLDIYPEVDASGNIVKQDFKDLDRKINAYRQAGISLDDMKIILFVAFDLNWVMKKNNKSQLKPWTPEWEKAFELFLNGLTAHLKKEYGLDADHLILYCCDEPHGDVEQSGSQMEVAYRAAKLIKKINPQVKTMVNPQIKEDALTAKNLQKLAEVYDILELYRGRTTPKIVKWAKDTGREIWTYHILQRTNSPNLYRRMGWLNLKDDISAVISYWHFDQMAGGDGFNAYDVFPRKSNSADYGTVYCDFNYGTSMTSRRQEAWYRGFLDYKLATYCRQRIMEQKKQGKDMSAQEKELDRIINAGVDGSMEAMEQARLKLLGLAVRLK